MSVKPKISIIMTCYNHEKYICEAIESILDQTLTEFELIIVDDGSTDKTKECINDFQDERIILIVQDNSGPSIAINKGLEQSRGDYIALMSGDDVALPHRLETQLAQIKESNSDIIFSVPLIIGPNSEFLPDVACIWFFGKQFSDNSELLRALFFEGNFLCAPTFFGRRSSLQDIGYFNRSLVQLQDYDYWIRACKKNKRIKLYQERVLKYRFLFGDNLSSINNLRRIETEKKIIFREFFDNLPDDIFLETFRKDFQREADHHADLQIHKSFLYLKHSESIIIQIGLESLISQFNNDDLFYRLEREWDFHFPDLLRLYSETSDDDNKILSLAYKTIIRILSKTLVIGAGIRPNLREPSVKNQISKLIKNKNYSKAIELEKKSLKYPLHILIIISLRKLLLILKRKRVL